MSTFAHFFATALLLGAMCAIAFAALAPIAVKLIALLIAFVFTSMAVELIVQS